MLGISHHSPVVISVYLDRLRFKDLFISIADVRSGEWQTKLKHFSDLPTDGRERVVLVESFAALQTMMREGADFQFVHVAIYDDCEVLATIPSITIVDAVYDDRWKHRPLGFDDLNDALAAIPVGLPSGIQAHKVETDHVPVPTRVAPVIAEEEEEQKEDQEETYEENEQDEQERSTLVMEQILDDMEAASVESEEDEQDEEEIQEERVLIRKRDPVQSSQSDTVEQPKPSSPQSDEAPESPVVQKSKKKGKGKRKPKVVSFQLF